MDALTVFTFHVYSLELLYDTHDSHDSPCIEAERELVTTESRCYESRTFHTSPIFIFRDDGNYTW